MRVSVVLLLFKNVRYAADNLKGYISASRGITWDAEKSKRVLVYAWSSALILPFGTQNVPALQCRGCELVLFRCGKGKSLKASKSYLKKCVRCGKKIPIASEECQYCGTNQGGGAES